MEIGQKISVKITEGEYRGKTLVLDVEDFLPYEPSNYVTTPGWDCAIEIDGESVWFFIDEGGVVWDADNDCVGTCPEQENWYEAMLKLGS
jgi:hypothetical protein